VRLVLRRAGSRRFKLPAEFPLTDGQGFFVIQDRRCLPDRRKSEHDLDSLKVKRWKMGGD